ncbi:hypothetical protein C8F01DRAFT_155735 [Mycena amicta]|nr:hypothetical protein C8F01DRAFT_155735 [Mycena amicta]
MIFGPLQGPEAENVPVECLSLGGEAIPWVEDYKYVGVWFSSVTRDIFRTHYEQKRETAAFVFWKTVLGCDHFVGRGRLPPDIGCQLYYALVDCHLTHACDIALDVDPTSFERLDSLNRILLRRILGVGKRSGVIQLYSELGIYPLRVRRIKLALSFLRYLVALPDSHLARKSLQEADRLRNLGYSSWMGDLAIVLGSLPFTMPPLPTLANLTLHWCNAQMKLLRARARRWVWETIEGMVSLPLLHGRLEPQEKEAPRVNQLCRRHYLSRVLITDHRLALTRLLNASFYFRGVRTNPEAHQLESLLCRKCALGLETPGHVFMQCRATETVEARRELQEALHGLGKNLPSTYTRQEAEELMRSLIFDWDAVVPMAWFIHKVVRSWNWFGRRLPTMVSELAPDSEDEANGRWDAEVETEDGSVDDGNGEQMQIDF